MQARCSRRKKENEKNRRARGGVPEARHFFFEGRPDGEASRREVEDRRCYRRGTGGKLYETTKLRPGPNGSEGTAEF